MRGRWLAGAVALLIPAQLFAAALADENLLQPLPPGFTPGWSTSRAGMDMTEFTVSPETVDNWTRLITTQIFHGKGAMPASGFIQNWGQRMATACPGLTHSPLTTGHRNGYVVSFVQVDCPRNPQTSKPEFVFIEALQGKDALYSVQYAFRYQPSQTEIGAALAFMRSVTVCDTRTADHPCANLPSPAPR